MLNENLKTLRKSKGLTQEELAVRLNVVRQTISKWEKGVSVPDADLLIRIAEIFEVSVSELLGSKADVGIDTDKEVNLIAENLSRINEQLAIKNRRSRRIWKTIAIIIAVIIAANILLVILGIVTFNNLKIQTEFQTDIEGTFTNKNENVIFDNAVPVEIDSGILQKCYDYTTSLGYEIKDKSKYKSVLLGESFVKAVHLDDDAKRDMLDENDYLIVFDEIRIVIDVDTGIVLGNIPYV